MRPYFEKMTQIGKTLSASKIKSTEPNVTEVKKVEDEIREAVEKKLNAGLPTEAINKRGQLTVMQRLEYLVDPGSWCPLHSIFDPKAERGRQHGSGRRPRENWREMGRHHRFR